MSDRKLLELAAKAYWGDEIDDVCSIRWLDADESIGYTHGDNQDHNGQDVELVWNPLTDDGDALRLSVKLKIEVMPGVYGLNRCDVRNHHGEFFTEQASLPGVDIYAATRRAIVRAAAEIGGELK